jgi:hypothetical protein
MVSGNAAASKSGLYADPREDWLAQTTEEIIDPKHPIVDPTIISGIAAACAT